MLVATMCADDETVFLFLVLALGAGSWGVLGGVGVGALDGFGLGIQRSRSFVRVVVR